MRITRKTVRIDASHSETRYFADTGDEFDGTARGYGFRSLERLHRAYWYFKNRPRLEALRSDARRFLRENPRAAAAIREYFSTERAIYAWKDGEILSMQSLVAELECTPGAEDVVLQLNAHRHLWTTLESAQEEK
ncbi:MAG: hypothetical protein WB947_08320 [Thermoplasmata archaeon]